MLEYISIKNVALIEAAEIEFDKGLNILSGETGAGKSMIIDAINFVLGEKMTKDFVRKGTEQASVEAMFITDKKDIKDIFEKLDINSEDNGEILIKRTISAGGKTINKVNGSTVTISMLKNISQNLIDIHGQHEHQSLLDPSKHILLLDKFCGEDLKSPKDELSVSYKEYKDITKRLKELDTDEKEKTKKTDLLKFQIQEIEDAVLKEGEEEELEEQRIMLGNAEKISSLCAEGLELISGEAADGLSTFDRLSKATGVIGDLSEIDLNLQSIHDVAVDIEDKLSYILRELRNYMSDINLDTNELDNVEERLNTIYQLKRKYGKSINEIFIYLNESKQELEDIEFSDETIKRLETRKGILETSIKESCAEITVIRKEKAKEIQEEIEKHLKDLNMKNASFKIDVERKHEININGWDKVEFMISPNLGEGLKPLSKIASGGEMSRVMLAIKTVLSDVDNIDTFVFDEIDTGVSGKTAHRVAEKLSAIGRTHQIICITHLPQIASMGDSHFMIEKNDVEGRTMTRVILLDKEKSVEELARLIGGINITEITLSAAREMKEFASKQKN